MANFDINVYIIARENVFHPCKTDRAPCEARLSFYSAGRAPYHIPDIGLCNHNMINRFVEYRYTSNIMFQNDIKFVELLPCIIHVNELRRSDHKGASCNLVVSHTHKITFFNLYFSKKGC